MSSWNSRITGIIEVYSINMQFVTSKPYESRAKRNQIIEGFGKMYPNRDYYLVIKPDIYEQNNRRSLMDLSKYDFPEFTEQDLKFSLLNKVPTDLLIEARKRDCSRGRKKFNEVFFNNKIKLMPLPDISGTWKEKAFFYAKVLMRSAFVNHEHKEAVCGMLFEECAIVD